MLDIWVNEAVVKIYVISIVIRLHCTVSCDSTLRCEFEKNKIKSLPCLALAWLAWLDLGFKVK